MTKRKAPHRWPDDDKAHFLNVDLDVFSQRSLQPRSGRDAWNRAYRRDFNIGIEGGVKPQFFELAIATETLDLIHAVDARLVVTVYAADCSHKVPKPSDP